VRIFLDTNVLASSVATRGLCSELLESIINEHELLTCEPVLQELRKVLTEKFLLPEPAIKAFLAFLRDEGELVAAHEPLTLSFKDPDDIAILACALSGRADVFVTGDKALFDLGAVRKMPILSPRQMWQRLAGMQGDQA
jgi:putative PIN family toxin of toxin-antitoxin system